MLPGTTLGLTELDMSNGQSMFDTPGIIVGEQITNRLIMEELAAVLPQKRVEHVTYRVQVGNCVHLGALCRIELVAGKPFFMTIFVGNQVTPIPHPLFMVYGLGIRVNGKPGHSIPNPYVNLKHTWQACP